MDERVIGIHANMVTMDHISIVEVDSAEEEEEDSVDVAEDTH